MRNLLVGSNNNDFYVVKISDFGMSRSLDNSYYKSDRNVPVKWSAPEVLLLGRCTSKSDVWSFGICLWEIFSFGTLPYAESTNDTARKQIIQGELLACPSNCPEKVYELMLWCWKKKAS